VKVPGLEQEELDNVATLEEARKLIEKAIHLITKIKEKVPSKRANNPIQSTEPKKQKTQEYKPSDL